MRQTWQSGLEERVVRVMDEKQTSGRTRVKTSTIIIITSRGGVQLTVGTAGTLRGGEVEGGPRWCQSTPPPYRTTVRRRGKRFSVDGERVRER